MGKHGSGKGGGGNAHDRAVARGHSLGADPASAPEIEHIPNPTKIGGFLRSLLLTVALFMLNVAFQLSQAKGWAGFVPDGVVIALWILPVVPLAIWLLTHERLRGSRAKLKAVYDVKPYRTVAAILLMFSLIGYSTYEIVVKSWALLHQQSGPAMPGISLNFIIRIRNRFGNERQYLADFGQPGNSRLSLYISPNKFLTLVLTDANGEANPLEIPLGEGVPIDRFILLTCEVGVKEKSTIMRVFVNGERIRNVELPFRLDLGTLDMPGGVVGADLQGQHGAEFDAVEIASNSATFSDAELAQMLCYARQLPVAHRSYLKFSGNQWIRARGTTFGHADLIQVDSKSAPSFHVFTADDEKDWLDTCPKPQ
jgi:hypothetical protein